MLAIHVLNVGHGDSIIVQYKCEETNSSHFGVIDSNCKIGITPKALTKLNELGAERLSFLVLTHPHLDHYSGLHNIVKNFTGKISDIYTFPVYHIKDKEKLKKTLQRYIDIANKTNDHEVKSGYLEFAKTIFHISEAAKNGANWTAPSGLMNQLICEGMAPDVEIYSLLPSPKVKGSYYTSIINGEISPESSKENELSLVILLKYKGREIVLGGDAVKPNWMEHSLYLKRLSQKLSVSVAKLPHHGSGIDSCDMVLNSLYTEESSEKIAIISANGHSHPDVKVLNHIKENNIKPYCTNLSSSCRSNIVNLINDNKVQPELNRFLNTFAIGNEKIQPCQGDISVIFNSDGTISVKTEYQHPCPYRGDFDFLNINTD